MYERERLRESELAVVSVISDKSRVGGHDSTGDGQTIRANPKRDSSGAVQGAHFYFATELPLIHCDRQERRQSHPDGSRARKLFLLLVYFGHCRLGEQEDAGYRNGVLQRHTDHFCRIDDSDLDQIDILI